MDDTQKKKRAAEIAAELRKAIDETAHGNTGTLIIPFHDIINTTIGELEAYANGDICHNSRILPRHNPPVYLKDHR